MGNKNILYIILAVIIIIALVIIIIYFWQKNRDQKFVLNPSVPPPISPQFLLSPQNNLLFTYQESIKNLDADLLNIGQQLSPYVQNPSAVPLSVKNNVVTELTNINKQIGFMNNNLSSIKSQSSQYQISNFNKLLAKFNSNAAELNGQFLSPLIGQEIVPLTPIE